MHSPLQPSAALRTGTRIEKINSSHGAPHPNGTHGTVTSSVSPQMWHDRMTQAYFVIWDGSAASVFIIGDKIRKLVKK